MKVAVLQAGNNGFFPRFYRLLHEAAEKAGDECRLFLPNTGVNRRTDKLPGQHLFGSRVNWHIHYLLYRLFGLKDCWSVYSTLCLIYKIVFYRPQIINFHVVGDCVLCLPLLVWYVNKARTPIVWTMHDCRAFTGGCPYFDELSCDEWIKRCERCGMQVTRRWKCFC